MGKSVMRMRVNPFYALAFAYVTGHFAIIYWLAS